MATFFVCPTFSIYHSRLIYFPKSLPGYGKNDKNFKATMYLDGSKDKLNMTSKSMHVGAKRTERDDPHGWLGDQEI